MNAKRKPTVQFTATRDETKLILAIVDRAASIAKKHGRPVDRQSMHMDIEATHCNGCPLRLDAMAKADEFNLAHDVFGIERHIDRSTGQLTGHFLPRFSA